MNVIELFYRLAIDEVRKLQSNNRTLSAGFVPHYKWQNVSDEFMKALEEGKTLEVSLIDKNEEFVRIEDFYYQAFQKT